MKFTYYFTLLYYKCQYKHLKIYFLCVYIVFNLLQQPKINEFVNFPNSGVLVGQGEWVLVLGWQDPSPTMRSRDAGDRSIENLGKGSREDLTVPTLLLTDTQVSEPEKLTGAINPLFYQQCKIIQKRP